MAILSHDQMRDLLAGQPGREFVLQATFQLYDWADRIPEDAIAYRIFRELTVRYYNGEKNRFGDEKADDYRFDAVILVEPGYRALARRQIFSVGVELKGDANDLKRDNKIQMYMGWTDFFYIGVPDELSNAAIDKANDIMKKYPSTKDRIGVFGVESGQIYKWPAKRIDVPLENRIAVQQQIIYNYCMKADKVITIDCEDIKIAPLPPQKPQETIATTRQTATPSNPQSPVRQPENKPGMQQPQPAISNQAKPLSSGPSNLEGTKKQLSEEEKAARRAERQRNKERVEQQRKAIKLKQEVLMPQTREKLAGLSDRDNLVFWSIRDSSCDGGIKGRDIIEQTGQSSRSVTRSIAALKEAGLISLDGSMKMGTFKAVGDAARDSHCMTCRKREQCQGNSLLCGSYQPREQLTEEAPNPQQI